MTRSPRPPSRSTTRIRGIRSGTVGTGRPRSILAVEARVASAIRGHGAAGQRAARRPPPGARSAGSSSSRPIAVDQRVALAHPRRDDDGARRRRAPGSGGSAAVTTVGSRCAKADSSAPLFVVAPAVNGNAARSQACSAAETCAAGRCPVIVTCAATPRVAPRPASSVRNACGLRRRQGQRGEAAEHQQVQPLAAGGAQRGQRLDQVAHALDRVHEAEEPDHLGVHRHAEPAAHRRRRPGRGPGRARSGPAECGPPSTPSRSASTRACPGLVVTAAPPPGPAARSRGRTSRGAPAPATASRAPSAATTTSRTRAASTAGGPAPGRAAARPAARSRTPMARTARAPVGPHARTRRPHRAARRRRPAHVLPAAASARTRWRV